MKSYNATGVCAALARLAEAMAAASIVDHTDKVARDAINKVWQECLEQGLKLTVSIEDHLGRPQGKLCYPVIVDNLRDAEKFLADAPLPLRVIYKTRVIRQGIETEGPDKFVATAAHARLLDLITDIIAELQEPKFLCIESGAGNFMSRLRLRLVPRWLTSSLIQGETLRQQPAVWL
jgi:hypothetical protein